MLFLQATIPTTSEVATSVFGISPTTVYGVFAGLLFLAVAILGALYTKSHDKLVAQQSEELKKSEEAVTQLVSENRELHKQMYDMGLSNIRTLEKFGVLLESFLSENRSAQKELMANIRDLTDSIRKSLEFSRLLVEQNHKTK
mgnify:CR=1 FL=1